jgi:type IX secretion system PorP/SprF family membrane protein
MRSALYISRSLFVVLQACMSVQLWSQDVHATQFFNTPYLINSGLVGEFEGQQRYMLYQRTQWKSITVPYKSFAVSGEARLVNLQKWAAAIPKFHAGVVLQTDRAGDSRFRTTGVLLQLGYPLNIEEWQCTPGLGIGLLSMSIDRSALYFDRNWNGQVFDPNSNTGETVYNDGFTRPQFNAGVSFKKNTASDRMVFGIGLFNSQRPNQNFISGAEIQLQRRLSIHGQWQHRINSLWQLEPLVLVMTQGPYRSINPGIRIFYNAQSPGIRSELYAGFMGRTQDAGNIIAGVQYDQWDIGLSYDINWSQLEVASRGRGGLELTAIYTIPTARHIAQYRRCKQWM